MRALAAACKFNAAIEDVGGEALLDACDRPIPLTVRLGEAFEPLARASLVGDLGDLGNLLRFGIELSLCLFKK